MKYKLRLLACSFFSAAILSTAHAQTKLDTVTVSATRTARPTFEVPGMASVVNVDSAENAGASNAKDVLKNVPGVEFQGSARRNGQVPVIRGFDADSILILFDGTRQNFQSAHDGQFFIDPDLLKSVEVVRSPSSSLYGSGGLGGVISFNTVDAADLLLPGETRGARVSVGGQSVDNERYVSTTGFGRSGDWDILGNVVLRGSGTIELGDGSTLDADDKMRSGLFKLSKSFNDVHTLRASYQGLKDDASEPNNPQLATIPGSNGLVDKDVLSQTGKFAYEYDNPENPLLKLKVQTYAVRTKVAEELRENVGTNRIGDVLTRELDTLGFNIDNQSRLASTDNIGQTLSYGLEYYTDEQKGSNSRTGDRGGVPNADADYYGMYLQDEIELRDPFGLEGQKLLIIPGGRFDKYASQDETGQDQDEQRFSPKIGVTYQPFDWLMFFGNYAEAFRAPNLTELYASGSHFFIGPFANNFVANANLRPEKSESFEFGTGVKFNDVIKAGDRSQIKVSRFQTDATDFIDSLITTPNLTGACFGANPPASCNGGTTQYINVPNANLWGIEVEGNYENDRWIADASFSFTNGKNEQNGNYLTNITPPTFRLHLGAKLPEYNSLAGWRSTLTTRHDKVNSVTAERPGYAVQDIYWQYQPTEPGFEALRINVGIDNVFDKAYERVFASSLEPGRSYYARLTFSW